jgi:hypothetical protein
LKHILGRKQDWQHILGKNMIDSTLWETYGRQHILGKNMSGSTFWEKTIIFSTFCWKNMIGSTFWKK